MGERRGQASLLRRKEGKAAGSAFFGDGTPQPEIGTRPGTSREQLDKLDSKLFHISYQSTQVTAQLPSPVLSHSWLPLLPLPSPFPPPSHARSMTASSAARRISLAIVRQDLRVHDQAVLLAAHEAGTHLLPLYVFDERHIELSGLHGFVRQGLPAKTRLCGFWRASVFRAKFITEAVYDLQDRLKQRNSNLLIRFGRLEEVVEEVVKTLQRNGDTVTGAWIQKDFQSEEVAIERKLEKKLDKLAVKTNFLDVQTLSKQLALRHPRTPLR